LHRPSTASAQRAVISDPLFSLASITTTARDKPLMIRLRSGKNHCCGPVPGTNSLTTAPVRSIAAASAACSGG
jgi:hypothetical protein